MVGLFFLKQAKDEALFASSYMHKKKKRQQGHFPIFPQVRTLIDTVINHGKHVTCQKSQNSTNISAEQQE